MANRKQFFGDPSVDEELNRLLSDSKQKSVSEEELHEQRISFAYGNAMDREKITKETVRKTSQQIRLRG